MKTDADIVTPEMLRNMVTSDHKRGCQGREYGCSCGYDDNKDRMIELAADALEKLRAERDAAARDMRERCAKAFEGSVHTVWDSDEIADFIRDLSLIATDGKDAT